VGQSVNDLNFTIENIGADTLNYEVTVTYLSGNGWLDVSPVPLSGALEVTETTSYAVHFNTLNGPGPDDDLAAGGYQAVIEVKDPNATNPSEQITVALSVLTPPDVAAEGCGNVPVYMSTVTNPAVLVLLDISSSMGAKMDMIQAEHPPTPDLSSIVQEIVDLSGWDSGNAMVFMIEGSGKRVAASYDGNKHSAPLLHVEYDSSGVFDRRIKQGEDDAEEKSGNAADLNDDRLELVEDGSAQTIGLRFTSVSIPQGASITKAYIEFFPAVDSSGASSLTITGQRTGNAPVFSTGVGNISSRDPTNNSVNWNPSSWTAIPQDSRINIGKAVIAEIFQDRSINWGYGNWCEESYWNRVDLDFTMVHVGTKPHDEAHQTDLQNAVSETEREGGTPFLQSLEAGRKYFKGDKNEWVWARKADDTINTSANPVGTESGDSYNSLQCQQKFLIDVTDGQGDSPPSSWYTANKDADGNPLYNSGDSRSERVTAATKYLTEIGVTPIAVGFGLKESEAGEIYAMAEESNIRGEASSTDSIYALHNEDASGDGVPFFANNKEEFLNALKSITESVKGAIFHGAAPAAATSTDLGDVVIVAKFDGARWTGDVEAIGKSGGVWQDTKWKASDELPSTRDVFTIDPTDPDAKTVVVYQDSTLPSDNWLCKDIGDIINSTPLVVGKPPFYYPFDDYRGFIWDRNFDEPRDSIIYIGANDGSLHAFDLNTGREKWAFVPKSMHDKLNLAGIDSSFDMCDLGYCHQYYVDGSPQAGDIYTDFGSGDEWRTILVNGLRSGGESYFALDVTTGESFDETAPQDRVKFLWEFNDIELGETWNDASIDRVAVDASSDKAWGVLFGSGYSKTDQQGKKAYMYGIQAHDASDLWKDSGGNTTNRVSMAVNRDLTLLKVNNYPVGDASKHFDIGETIEDYGDPSCKGEGRVVSVTWTSSDYADILVADIDDSWNQSSCNAYRGKSDPDHKADKDQNATSVTTKAALPDDALSSPLVVDIEDDWVADRIYTGNLYGDMFRVTNIGKGKVPVVERLFTFDHSLPNVNPIRAKADMAYTKVNGEIWVYFGTGIYEQQAHKTNTITQYFFGLQDTLNGVATYEMSDLAALKAEFTTTQIDSVDVVVRTVSGENPPIPPYSAGDTPISWAMELGQGASGSERVIVKPLVIGGIVFFTTFVPDADVCEGAGDTWVFALDYQSGLAPTDPIFDLSGDGYFDDDDKVDTDGDGIKDTIPIGIHVGRGKGSHPVLHKDTLFITTTGSGDDVVSGGGGGGGGGGGLKALKVNLQEIKVRVKAWKQS
jgi:hypothetical protein